MEAFRILLKSGRADVNLPIRSGHLPHNMSPQITRSSGALVEAVRNQQIAAVGLLQNFGAINYENQALALAVEVFHNFDLVLLRINKPILALQQCNYILASFKTCISRPFKSHKPHICSSKHPQCF